MPNVIPTAHVISSKGCPQRGDGLHFTAEGYRIIGKRYAETMLDLLNTETGIKDINTKKQPTESRFFDLSGRNVGNDFKGLLINQANGKKFINK